MTKKSKATEGRGGLQHQSSAQALQEGEEEGPCKPATNNPIQRAPPDLRHHERRGTTLNLATSDMQELSEAMSPHTHRHQQRLSLPLVAFF